MLYCENKKSLNYKIHLYRYMIIDILIFVIYFLPTFLALGFRRNSVSCIIIINALLGWTIIGYVFCLILLFKDINYDD